MLKKKSYGKNNNAKELLTTLSTKSRSTYLLV